MVATHYPAVFELQRQRDNGTGQGSAVLLEGGRFVLTAAHLVADAPSTQSIRLRSQDLTTLPDIKAIHTHPAWNSETFNHDIALIELAEPITAIQGMPVSRQAPEPGQDFIRVGYGKGFEQGQHIGTNQWDSTGEALNGRYDRQVPDGSQLLADFDNGTWQQNALSHFDGVSSSAIPTQQETLSLAGDSGGPALVNNEIAGIASYIVADPEFDSDPSTASSPGELSSDTNVAAYQHWLDYIMFGNPDYQPPAQPQDVHTTLTEPDYGTVVNHFMLSVEQPVTHTVTLYYQTYDLSAVAGEDYQATRGWLTLNPGETRTTIAVTILGDTLPEGDETFGMQVSDPSGQWLQNGVTLLAVHSIQDNDLVLA